MRGVFLAVCAVLLLLSPRFCASAVPNGSPLAGTTLTVLPSGLRVLVREQHSAPLVAVDVWVRAGSARERAGEEGAAHFLEHVIFKGTPTRKPGEIDAAIEDLGATLYAGTTRDAAHFYTTVAAQYLGTALDVIADALQHAALDPREVERERAVILDEMARARNDHRKQALNALYARLYPTSARGNPILGTPETLARIPRDAIAAFYARWYAPNNATVVVVGDVTLEAARAAVERAFGGWPRKELPADAAQPQSGQQPGDTRTATPGGETASYACGALVGDGGQLTETCAADVLMVLLADSANGLLPRELAADAGTGPKSRAPTVSALDADYAPARGHAVFAVYARAQAEQLPAVRQRVAAVLDALAAAPPDSVELEYARRRVLGDFLADVETVGGQARTLGQYDMVGDYSDAVGYVEAVRNLAAGDISTFVKRYLDSAHRVEVVE